MWRNLAVAVVSVVIAAGCSSEPPEPSEPVAKKSSPVRGTSGGRAGGSAGSAIFAARGAAYAQLGAAAIAPLAALGESRGARLFEEGRRPRIGVDDAVFLRKAVLELGDFERDGSRPILVTCTWEDSLGRAELETREGRVIGPNERRRIEWLGPPRPQSGSGSSP